MFFLADLLDDNYGPTFESSDVKLFDVEEILWDELAFPFVPTTLKNYFKDSKRGEFPLSTCLFISSRLSLYFL